MCVGYPNFFLNMNSETVKNQSKLSEKKKEQGHNQNLMTKTFTHMQQMCIREIKPNREVLEKYPLLSNKHQG